ncbi:MAG TPA: tRNA (adenosine(37)-N6)-threonylcarbamoyltransferase complex dimerization subunit type 1 TsaB [Moraxellaceae bacterium]|nr:tRNA (adenosine(37)-N6)-threonylcarbamoyltransferase complex dimerization subunit type 1 TsaB [Moraxellaceae bacterium]
MKLLALETSTEACSVALAIDGRVISRFRHAPRLQTDLLLPMADEVLAEAGVPLGDLDVLAYSRGPGAFTGVRIAAAAVQAFAFARDLPVVAVSSLQTLAQGTWRVHGAERVLSVFDARMDEVYAGGYVRQGALMQPVGDEVLCAPAELPAVLKGEWFAAGNGVAAYEAVLRQQCMLTGCDATLFPSAEDVVPLALERFAREGGQPAELALPVYLRDEVWKKLPGR